MELLHKLEQQILKWIKGVPHLPTPARKWLGDNIWWIALIGTIVTGIIVLFGLIGLLSFLSVMGTVAASYYATSTFTSWAIVTTLVSLAFSVLQGLILLAAINPLKAKQKKGWVLLFASWLLGAVAVVVNAVLTLSPFGFIGGLLFGAVGLAISGYFLFEIHSQFAHVERSKGVKSAKTTEHTKK